MRRRIKVRPGLLWHIPREIGDHTFYSTLILNSERAYVLDGSVFLEADE